MSFDLGMLILRVVVGLILFGHGAQKLFGWFGGGGLNGTAGMMGSLGMHPAGFWAFMAGLCEAGGGLLLALGLFNPLGSLGIIAAMLTATIKVHWTKGLWGSKGGYELPLTNIVVALAVAIAGPGAYSVDALIRTRIPEPATLVIGLVVVVLGIIMTSAIPAGRSAQAS